MIDEELNWQQQAEIYQDALETALAKVRDLEGTNESLDSILQHFLREMPAMRVQHQEALLQCNQEIHGLEQTIRRFQNEIRTLEQRHEDTLMQRDQVIISRKKR